MADGQPLHGSPHRPTISAALGTAVLPVLIWGIVFAVVLAALPGWAWRAKVLIRQEEGLILIGVIGLWRYGWFVTHLVRGFFYTQFVYPSLRASAQSQRNPWPQRLYFLIPSYYEDPGVTARVVEAMAREIRALPHIDVHAVATLGSDEEEDLFRRLFLQHGHPPNLRMTYLRQSKGKRHAMADALRVIGQIRSDDLRASGADADSAYDDVIIFMDGDTEVGEGTVAQCLPYFRAFPKLGALTTDELGRIYRASPLVREWFSLKFIKRHSIMKSIALSRKVLTLTGRYSVFRADAVLSNEMVSYLEDDHIQHWVYGRIRFLMGDDKSTWFVLLKNGWEMFYLPDVVVYSLETRTQNFFKLSRSLMLRWNGNTMRTNARTLDLGPKRIGAFIWYAVLDQRISMWTTLIAPFAMLLLTIFVTPWFAAFYVAWIIMVRLFQILVLVLQGHQMRIVDLPLQLYDQWVGSFVKVRALFNLGEQKWSKAKSSGDSGAKLPWSRRWMPTFQVIVSLVALLLFVGVLTSVFRTPNLFDFPSAVERAMTSWTGSDDTADRPVRSASDRMDDERLVSVERPPARTSSDPLPRPEPPRGDQFEAEPIRPGLAPTPSPGASNDDEREVEPAATPSNDLVVTTESPAALSSRTIRLTDYGARANDSADDSPAFRAALADLAGGGTLLLPDGVLYLDAPVHVTRSNVTIRGGGMDQTQIVVRMTKQAAGEGEAAFFIEGDRGGSLGKVADTALRGSRRINLTADAPDLPSGTLLWFAAENDDAFLRALGTQIWDERYPQLQQFFSPVSAVAGSRISTLRSLDLDLPPGTDVRLVRPAKNVVLERFGIRHEIPGARPAEAAFVYENLYPDYQVSSIRYLWAEGGGVRDVAIEMTGKHALAFERSYAIEGEGVIVNGAWNKGKGGTGYVRFSQAQRCTLRDVDIRGIRHVVFQWGASHNRIVSSRLYVDVNFHGGFARYNRVERTIVDPPPQHPWPAVIQTPNDARWAPPDGPGNTVEGYTAVFPGQGE